MTTYRIHGTTGEWEVVIGLEVHAQVTSKAKLFSGAATAFGAAPNTQACAVDLALPGTLPVLNRGAVERALHLPVIYNNDGNAAALYAHERQFGPDAALRSSISAIVGTGLGGGVIESGGVVRGASGMAGELGRLCCS